MKYAILILMADPGQNIIELQNISFFPTMDIMLLAYYSCISDIIMIINQFNDHDSKDQVYPDNHQQLLNVFYPINRAKPSSIIIAYFTNYTDPLPEECSLGTYPWKTYPRIYTLLYNIADRIIFNLLLQLLHYI